MQITPLTPSFIRATDGDRVDLWAPERSGNWATDNATGRRYARECIRYMELTEFPVMLGHVVEAIIRGGVYGGVEVGFFHQVAVSTTTHVAVAADVRQRAFEEVPLAA